MNEENNLNNDTNNKKINYAGETALSLSLLVVVLFLVCIIFSGGMTEAMVLPIFYCVFCEIPVTIASIIFGLIGLKNKNKTPSYISFVVNGIKIVIIVLLILSSIY